MIYPFSSKVKELLSKEWEFTKLAMSYLSIMVTAVAIPFVTILFAGNIDQAHLDGVGLANTIYNVVVMSVSSGYSSVFDTYGPQVYSSADPSELSTVLLKCLLQGGMVHLVILGPYLNLVYAIDLLPNSGLYPAVQEEANTVPVEDFREIAVQYLRLTALAEYLDYAVTMIQRYLAIQGQTKLVYTVSVVRTAVHVITNYLLVSVLGLKVTGLGLAAIIGRTIALAFAVGICIVNIKRGIFPWSGLKMKVLMGWKPMMKLGISGALNVFAEVALYEISTFCSQFAGTTTLSVVIILIQIMSVWWSIAFSISRTAATLIGKALAEGSALDVKRYTVLTLINTFLEIVPLAVGSYFLRGYLVRIFQHDPDVVDLFVKVFWLACLGLTVTHFQTNMNQGVLIAFGEQKFIAWSTSISCYGVALPFIIMTLFLTDLGIIGIFLGWILSDTIILIAALVKISKTDINNEIQRSVQRVTASTGEDSNKCKSEVRGFENPVYEAGEEDVKLGTGTTTTDLKPDLCIKDPRCNQDRNMSGDGRSAEEVGVVNPEAKRVQIAFLVSGAVCVALAGISLIRDFKN